MKTNSYKYRNLTLTLEIKVFNILSSNNNNAEKYSNTNQKRIIKLVENNEEIINSI